MMLRNMVASLFENESIKTTEAKAKEARKLAEKLLTWGKRGDLHSRRLALRYVSDAGLGYWSLPRRARKSRKRRLSARPRRKPRRKPGSRLRKKQPRWRRKPKHKGNREGTAPSRQKGDRH